MPSRNTIQRQLVYEALQQLDTHATADEIFAEVARMHPSISRATVYRNLNVLSQEKRITRVPMPNGAVRYDRRASDHQHASCKRCGNIFDVDIMDMEAQFKEAAARFGFNLTDYDVFLYGLCKNCNAEIKESEGKS